MSREVLLAAIDAAATEAEWDALMEAVEHDPAIKAEWSRWWEMRDAQQGVALAGSGTFADGVMAAIRSEAPVPARVVPFAPRAAMKAPAAANARRRSWWVPASAAAGIAGAVVLVGVLRQQPPAPAADAALAVSAGPALATQPVAYGPAGFSSSEASPDAATAELMNQYLIEHSGAIAERSMAGALANARFAARTADYRPGTP